ncbi:MAG: phage structural protein [Fusobacteriaceae bacterium]
MARLYNPKEVVAIVSGYIVEGFSEDTHIEVTPTEDLHTLNVGNDGNGTFNINPNESGTIKFNLQHNSDSFNFLTALQFVHVAFPIIIMDNNKGGQKVAGLNCLLKSQINFSRAKEIGNQDIEFICEKVKIIGL